ncbi:hypothetical protein ACN38_g3388 [Penicillium nordicum]|uniref:Uncharacterized protein n=1 Tax=Penicillium nordicum TaxID=229535 RepID=A0A0M8P8E0_9EURO|nr:hypothetical protein ACN38_g3388 [Penicillium nordicum]
MMNYMSRSIISQTLNINNPAPITFCILIACELWPSWSKAHGSGPPDPDGTQLSPCLARGVGSNPTLIICFCFFFTFGLKLVSKALIEMDMNKNQKDHDKSGIRTHASCETRKLLLVVESRYTLTWRLRPTRPSYQR